MLSVYCQAASTEVVRRKYSTAASRSTQTDNAAELDFQFCQLHPRRVKSRAWSRD